MLAMTSRFRLPALISAVLAILMMLGTVPATAADTATASVQGKCDGSRRSQPRRHICLRPDDDVPNAGGPVRRRSGRQLQNHRPPGGSYKLNFSGGNTGAQEQWYKNAASYETATAVTVTAGQALTGINAHAGQGRHDQRETHNSGRCQFIQPICVCLVGGLAAPGGPVRSGRRTASYKINGLPAGSYKLNFSGWNTGLQDQWYKNAASYETAAAVTVTAGQDVTGINATLVKGATISGKVSVPVGLSLPEFLVTASRDGRTGPEGRVRVEADGSYKIIGLTAGSYSSASRASILAPGPAVQDPHPPLPLPLR